MSKRSSRLIITVLALVGGILIILMLSLAGDKSRGPIANLLNNAGDFVSGLEDRYIHKKRIGKRKDKLVWMDDFRNDPALLKDPKMLLMGAYDNHTGKSFSSIIDLEDSLGMTFPLVHIYVAWGDKPEEAFPEAQLKAIRELGSIPVVTWEPWLSDFDARNYPGLGSLEERDKGSLATIASGMFDDYILSWARAAAEYDYPLFIRVGHEMNDPYRYPWGPHNNAPEDFVAAWRHINVLFKGAGADNVLWIWSPHPSYGMFEELYPGEYFVDYIGINVLNFGDVASWSAWWTFDQIIDKAYTTLSAYGKPMMISELGCLSVGGIRADWYRGMMQSLPVKYPDVKVLLHFHYSEDQTTTPQTVDWTIDWDTDVINAVREEYALWPDSLKAP